MQKLLLISALSLLPMAQALANVTIHYDIEKGSTELSTHLTGKGRLSAPSGSYHFKMFDGSVLSCKIHSELVEGNRYRIFYITKGPCGIQDCGTAKECPPLPLKH